MPGGWRNKLFCLVLFSFQPVYTYSSWFEAWCYEDYGIRYTWDGIQGSSISKRAERWRLSTIFKQPSEYNKRGSSFPLCLFSSSNNVYVMIDVRVWRLTARITLALRWNGERELCNRKSVGTVADTMELAARMRTTSAGRGPQAGKGPQNENIHVNSKTYSA